MNTISFYLNPRYPELRNTHYNPIRIDGKLWQTVQHYMEAMKFEDEDMQEQIREASASEAIRLGNNGAVPWRKDYDVYQVQAMKKALQAKFTQHRHLKEKLLATEDATLIYDAPLDYFWGTGEKKTGQNKLGKLMMMIRAELAKQLVTGKA